MSVGRETSERAKGKVSIFSRRRITNFTKYSTFNGKSEVPEIVKYKGGNHELSSFVSLCCQIEAKTRLTVRVCLSNFMSVDETLC